VARSWRLHLPLIRAVASGVVPYLLAVTLQAQTGRPLIPEALGAAVLWFLAGSLYTQLFEYVYHRWPMHVGVRHLEHAKRTHLEHHRIFTGERFRSREAEDLRYVVSEWYVFPMLFAVHYSIFLLIFPAAYAPLFFLGVTAHFLAYEVCHWFTHVEDNAFDRVLGGIPLVRSARAYQMRHHQLHHAIPVVNFNFTPPYTGDRLAATLGPDESLPSSSPHERTDRDLTTAARTRRRSG